MNTIQFRRGPNGQVVFTNHAGEDVAKGLPSGPWEDHVGMDGWQVGVSFDHLARFGSKIWKPSWQNFWACWPALLRQEEVDDASRIDVEFTSSAPTSTAYAKEIWIQGQCRALFLDFGHLDCGSWRDMESILEDLQHLQVVFFLNVEKGSLDLSKLSSLRDLWCLGMWKLASVQGLGIPLTDQWDDFVGLPRLRSLQLGGFQSPKDCACLSELASLERLEISDAINLRGFKGLAPLQRLKHLVIKDAGQLVSFRRAGRLSALKSLEVVKAPRLTSLEGITSFSALEQLRLGFADGLKDIGELSQLSRLKRVNISSKSLRDVSHLAGHPSLERLTVQGPGFNVEVESNREALASTPRLKELRGFEESVRVEVLFRAALLREDQRMMRRLLSEVLEFHRDGKPEGRAVRQAVIQSLMSLNLKDEEWKVIHDFPWSPTEWADLFVATDSCGSLLESQLAEFKRSEKGTLFKDVPHLFRWVLPKDEGSHIRMEGRIEVKDAFKGYIHAAARDNGWDGDEQMIQFAARLFLKNDVPHESWEEIQIDLLLATLELGLEEQHGQLLTHITDTQRSEFKEQLVWRRANEAVSMKRLDEAVECLPLLNGSKQSRLMGRILPLWVEKIPDTIMDWFAEELPDLEQVAKMQGVPVEEVLQNPFAREVAFFLAATDLEDFQKLLASLQKAFPEDAQVKALMAEVGLGRGANQDVMETLGLEMLWQDEAFRAEVGARNLRKLMEARGQEAAAVRERARQATLDLLRREDLID